MIIVNRGNEKMGVGPASGSREGRDKLLDIESEYETDYTHLADYVFPVALIAMAIGIGIGVIFF